MKEFLEEMLKSINEETNKNEPKKPFDIKTASNEELRKHLEELWEKIDIGEALREIYLINPTIASLFNVIMEKIAKLMVAEMKRKISGISQP
jgi:transposase-like protein